MCSQFMTFAGVSVSKSLSEMARDPVFEVTEQMTALGLSNYSRSGALSLDSPRCPNMLHPPSGSQKPNQAPFLATSSVPSRRQRGRVTKKRPRRRRSLAQSISFCPKFVRKDAIPFFAQTWKPTLMAWNSLLLATTLPESITRESLNVSVAVRTLNRLIVGRGESLPPRFGYVQLSRFLSALEHRIKQGRENGSIPSESGRVHASIAIDMYLEAQGTEPNVLLTRGKIWEYKRIGRRWEELVGPSVLLLGIYSDVAEAFVHVPLQRL